MATLTATLDNDGVDLAQGTIRGTFATGSGTAPTVDQIELVPSTAYVDMFSAVCQDGLGVIRAKRNYNSAGVATNGTILIESNDSVTRTYTFLAKVHGL